LVENLSVSQQKGSNLGILAETDILLLSAADAADLNLVADRSITHCYVDVWRIVSVLPAALGHPFLTPFALKNRPQGIASKSGRMYGRSLMSDEVRVKSDAALVRRDGWLALALALLVPFALPDMIKESGVLGGAFGFLFWEGLIVLWAYSGFRPYLTVWQWQRAGEYERRNWSPEQRGLERGKILVFLYRTTNADSNKRVLIETLKQFGGWTFAELHNLLHPLVETDILDLYIDDEANRLIAFAEAEVRLTPSGVLATEDAVTQARTRPGYSITIHGNDNQVQVATLNSEQLKKN
jgi:hypothetical protein